jgi:hypothetical protein
MRPKDACHGGEKLAGGEDGFQVKGARQRQEAGEPRLKLAAFDLRDVTLGDAGALAQAALGNTPSLPLLSEPGKEILAGVTHDAIS